MLKLYKIKRTKLPRKLKKKYKKENKLAITLVYREVIESLKFNINIE